MPSHWYRRTNYQIDYRFGVVALSGSTFEMFEEKLSFKKTA